MAKRKKISPETKEKALADLKGGMTLKDTAAKHGVSTASLMNWKGGSAGGKRSTKSTNIELMQIELDYLLAKLKHYEK